MLSSQDQQLLTGYVDGELTARQHCQVERLLSRSGEARALLQDLQADSRALRLLPSMSAPADLADSILETIARKGLKPGSRPRVPTPPRVYVLPSWVGFAAAAAVLFIVATMALAMVSERSRRVAVAD
jgi:anti-sigma factor RsiW